MTVLVTGADRGIGLEFVRQYASGGHRVIAGCLDVGGNDITSLQAEYPELVHIRRLDVSDQDVVSECASDLRDTPIDILINNAGINPNQQSWSDVEFTAFEKTFQVNAFGPLRVALAFRPHLLLGSSKKVVTISSDMASTSIQSKGNLAYCGSKAAVNNLMRSLAFSWADDGFLGVLVHPGWTLTTMNTISGSPPSVNVTLIINLIERLAASDNGRFMNNVGDDMPW